MKDIKDIAYWLEETPIGTQYEFKIIIISVNKNCQAKYVLENLRIKIKYSHKIINDI